LAVRKFIQGLQALNGWQRALAAAAAGALSALALAPVFAWPVMFLTVPMLVWLLDAAVDRAPAAVPDASLAPSRSAPASKLKSAGLADWLSTILPPRYRAAFGVGWLFGFGYFLAGLYWIGAPFLVEADTFGWLLPFAVTIMPAGLALFFGAATALATRLWLPGWGRILSLAVAFGGCEWLRGHVLTGFPWNLVGYTLSGNDALLQVAALVGVNGLTFLSILLFASPALLSEARGWRHPGVVLPVAALLLAYVFGTTALRRPMPEPVPGAHLRLVQPNISQAQKWTPDNKSWIFQGFLDLSRLDRAGRSDDLAGITHVIWPESSVPFLLLDSPNALRAIADLLPRGAQLLTGGLRLEQEPPTGDGSPSRRVFNSLIALDGEARTVALYDKTHLVPFGEYLPLQPLLEAIGLRQLTKVRGGFTAGKADGRLMRIPGLPPFSPLICYEIIFPAAAVPSSAHGADRPGFLLNVTNDAWFGTTSGPYQHLQQARVRAVEEGLPVIRVANTGISAIIDARGRVLDRLPLNARGTLDVELPGALAVPLYGRLGDLVPAGMMVLGLLALLILGRAGRRQYP